MKKTKYKSQIMDNDILKIILILFLTFIFFLADYFIQIFNSKTSNVSLNTLSTIKEVIEYHNSKYISEKESKDEDYYLEAYLNFKMPLYTEEKVSNENYYTNLINDCAKVLYYKSFKLIDEKNNIKVEVICKDSEIVSITINGIEDYFIYMDSQIGLEQYTENPVGEFEVNSPILQACIDNNWDKNVEFGSRESIFDNYNIYFDEGLKVRIISGKIYNIIFEKTYNQNVINDLFPGIDFEVVKSELGKPTFEDKELNIIGYKGNKFYIFFLENEISIYRNTEEETNNFFNLADKFINEEIDILEFMNELTYIWPDYSEYEYDTSTVYISYPLKGVEIRINYDDNNGILLYNNIKADLPKVGRYLENTYFVSRLQLDLVFNAEKRRINNEKKILDNCLEFKKSISVEDFNIIGESLKYDIYPLIDDNGYIFSMRFISKNGTEPNRELNDGISTYMWLNDFFIYSKRANGIYAYDTNTGIVKRLITGDDDYNIKGFENGILKYDDKELVIEY